MNHFIIDGDDFGIDKLEYSIENNLLSLKIFGSKERFNNLCETENSKWLWALYAPEIYFYDIPLKKNRTIKLNDKLAQSCDFALYMMSHNDIDGKITIKNNIVSIVGKVYIMGKVYSLDVETTLE